MLCQLWPRVRAPRYWSIKMHDQLSSMKSERYVVFYLQQVDARKHQEISSTFVLCTWQWIGIFVPNPDKMAYMSVCGQYHFYKSLRGALASSANRLGNGSRGLENGTGSNNNSIGEIGGEGWRQRLSFRFRACHNLGMFLNMNLSVLWNGSHSHSEWNSMASFPILIYGVIISAG